MPAEPTLHYIPYERFLDEVETVARAIEADDWQPDLLVGIGRGGLVPAAYLSHRTGIQMLSVDHSSGETGFGDELLDKLAAKIRGGHRILIVDDINDSGGTIAYLRAAVDGQERRSGGLADRRAGQQYPLQIPSPNIMAARSIATPIKAGTSSPGRRSRRAPPWRRTRWRCRNGSAEAAREMVLDSIRGNLARLFVFAGRDRPGQFWPYAAFVVGLFMIAVQAWTFQPQADAIANSFEMARDPLAAPPPPPADDAWDVFFPDPDENPYAVDYRGLPGGIAALAAFTGFILMLLAAAVTRRLHDRDRSGLWGLLPLPFLAATFALAQRPRAPLRTLFDADPGFTAALLASGLLYIASFLFLIALLGGEGTEGPNRYGADPRERGQEPG